MRDLRYLFQDIRYTVRSLLRTPGFTAIAILALALGIGASTTIFSVVNGVLLKSLPYRDPDRLVMLWEKNLKDGHSNSVSGGDYSDWKAQNRVFEDIGYSWDQAYTLTGSGEPESVIGYRFSANFFDMLAAKPFLGRTFLPEDGRPGKPLVAVISHRLWRSKFGSNPRILGNNITLDGKDYNVIGVMPPGFGHPSQLTDIWTPLWLAPDELTGRRMHILRLVARLKPGIRIEQAQAEMSAIADRLAKLYPATNAGWGAEVRPLRDHYIGDIRPALLVLQAAVLFLLLIACANIANLLLARAAARQREVAIRAALGASRSRLLRQFITEGLVLSFAGGAAGLLLASWGVQLAPALFPKDILNVAIPAQAAIWIDARVLAFTLLVSIGVGLIFGAVPAFRAAAFRSPGESLKDGGRSFTAGQMQNRLRAALMISEIALSLILLVGSGLMVKSFLRLQDRGLGFNTDRVLTMQLLLPTNRYGDLSRAAAFVERTVERLQAVPGVESAAAVNTLPLTGASAIRRFDPEGTSPPPPGQENVSLFKLATPDYFRALGVPQRMGRYFTARDRIGSADVVIVNEMLARHFWPNQNPVGKHIAVADMGTSSSKEIVGVVGDTRHFGLAAGAGYEIYRPFYQAYWPFLTLAVRTSGDPMHLANALRAAVWSVDKDEPIAHVITLEEIASQSLAMRRVSTIMLGALSVMALLLASIGIYGVISYSVGQRTHEIGIRMALGAQGSDVLRMVVGQGLVLALLGIGIGAAGAAGLTRFLSSLLFGVKPTDAVTFVSVSLLLAGIAMLASYVPARRAMRVDPMIALRYE